MVARLISAVPILDDYFIIWKYNELNYHDRAQIKINVDKNIIQVFKDLFN
jgi:hypothetical protein